MLPNATPDINTDDHRWSIHSCGPCVTQRTDSAIRHAGPRAISEAAPDDDQHVESVHDADRLRPDTPPPSPDDDAERRKRKRRGYRFHIPRRIAQGYGNVAELQRHWAYEESTTKYILRRYGLKDLGRRLWRMGKEQHGFGHLLLADFCTVTQFPIWLQSCPVDTTRLTLADLLGDLKRTPVAAALVQICREVPARAFELPIGLVFPMPGVRFMAMHSWEHGASDRGTQLLRAGRFRSRDIVWVIEPLGALLDKIDAEYGNLFT
jgi:hypothetical protein